MSNDLNRNYFPISTLTTAVILTLIVCSVFSGCATYKVFIDENAAPLYYGTIQNIDQVYDGDTIQDVSILIFPFKSQLLDDSKMPLTIWPGVERHEDGIYSVTNIRIAGIDTPEKRPRRADRTEASLQREKDRAEAATNFLKQLIIENTKENGELGFYIQNPEFGVYAGRIVAELFFFNHGIIINLADELLKNGHAVEYDGGTKTHDWGAE